MTTTPTPSDASLADHLVAWADAVHLTQQRREMAQHIAEELWQDDELFTSRDVLTITEETVDGSLNSDIWGGALLSDLVVSIFNNVPAERDAFVALVRERAQSIINDACPDCGATMHPCCDANRARVAVFMASADVQQVTVHSNVLTLAEASVEAHRELLTQLRAGDPSEPGHPDNPRSSYDVVEGDDRG